MVVCAFELCLPTSWQALPPLAMLPTDVRSIELNSPHAETLAINMDVFHCSKRVDLQSLVEMKFWEMDWDLAVIFTCSCS